MRLQQIPSWIVTVALAAVVALVLLAAGGSEGLIILAVLLVWFAVLAGLALVAETGMQTLGRLWRRGS